MLRRCADFYRYVCRSWEGKKSSFEQDQQNALAEQMDARFGRYDVRRADELGTHVAATVYAGCNQFLSALSPPSFDSYKAARTTILTPKLRAAANFTDIIQILVRVSLELGLYTVIAIEVIHLDQGDGKGQASLHFSPGKSLLRKLGQTSYEELTRSMPRLYIWWEEAMPQRPTGVTRPGTSTRRPSSVSEICARTSIPTPAGLRIAHAALRSWFITASIDADVFGRYWHPAEVIFFERFCLLSCSAENTRSGWSLPARERCLVPLHNFPDFAEAFSCKEKQNYVGADCPV
ncbi:uncharacterized protein LOC144151806 [Haemaphysalis longicornis]